MTLGPMLVTGLSFSSSSKAARVYVDLARAIDYVEPILYVGDREKPPICRELR